MKKPTALFIIAIGIIVIGVMVIGSNKDQEADKSFERTITIKEHGDCCIPITKQSNTTISVAAWNEDSIVLKISNESAETNVTLWRRFGNPTIIIFNNSKISLGLLQYGRVAESRFARIWLVVEDI